MEKDGKDLGLHRRRTEGVELDLSVEINRLENRAHCVNTSQGSRRVFVVEKQGLGENVPQGAAPGRPLCLVYPL